MSTKIFKILQFTIVGVTLLSASDGAYSWYICAKGDWDTLSCGTYTNMDGPNSGHIIGVRWSYAECKNFEAMTVPHKSDVSVTADSWTAACEIEPSVSKQSQGPKKK